MAEAPVAMNAGAGTLPTGHATAAPTGIKKGKGGEAFDVATSTKQPEAVTAAKAQQDKKRATKGKAGAKKGGIGEKLNEVKGKVAKTINKMTGKDKKPKAEKPVAKGSRASTRVSKMPEAYQP